jgi:hypothetical protein
LSCGAASELDEIFRAKRTDDTKLRGGAPAGVLATVDGNGGSMPRGSSANGRWVITADANEPRELTAFQAYQRRQHHESARLQGELDAGSSDAPSGRPASSRAGGGDRELARQVKFLKVENEIL